METTSPRISKQELNQFTGTTQYYRHRISKNMSILLTDGTHYVREQAQAYWLFDLILSYQYKLAGYHFQRWHLERLPDDTWFITCSDGDNNTLASQEIQYSDFPLNSITIWLIDGVALLPTEY